MVPLRDHDGQTIGVLELLNARDANDRRYVSFKPLEPIIRAFAAQAAVCINNALLIEQNDHLIGLLNETNQRLEAENRQLKEGALPLKSAVKEFEVSVIKQHLQANNWNQTRAAETLQIPRRTLIDKMSRYSIKAPDLRKRLRMAR
jgi:DNA-binding NtrC family response regulator